MSPSSIPPFSLDSSLVLRPLPRSLLCTVRRSFFPFLLPRPPSHPRHPPSVSPVQRPAHCPNAQLSADPSPPRHHGKLRSDLPRLGSVLQPFRALDSASSDPYR